MNKALGYFVAALAGVGFIVVVDAELFNHPELLFRWV
jgi:hypothetical protein